MSDITQILSAIEQGDSDAAEQLLPLVYDELRKLATAKMTQEKPGQTLQATALVHEAYLRLVGSNASGKGHQWDGRGHFYAAAAEAMRRILIENARRKQRIRHGGDRRRIDLQTFDPAGEGDSEDLLVLDEALTELATEDESVAEVVKLRYFAGLTIKQTATTLGISEDTTNRKWAFARASLYHKIYGDSEEKI